MCGWCQGGLSVNYSDNYYHLSQRHPDVPRLTQQHYEAMALFNEIASSDALRMDAMLQPGDIQLLNNHTQLHTRAEFEDYPVSTVFYTCCTARSVLRGGVDWNRVCISREFCPACQGKACSQTLYSTYCMYVCICCGACAPMDLHHQLCGRPCA